MPTDMTQLFFKNVKRHFFTVFNHTGSKHAVDQISRDFNKTKTKGTLVNGLVCFKLIWPYRKGCLTSQKC